MDRRLLLVLVFIVKLMPCLSTGTRLFYREKERLESNGTTELQDEFAMDWYSSFRKFDNSITVGNMSDTACYEDFQGLIQGLESRQPWAISMLDSYGKVGSGVTRGNTMWPGMYPLCRGVKATVRTTNGNETNFNGQYCWMAFTLPDAESFLELKGKFRTGICVPDSCSSQNVDSVIYSIKDKVAFLSRIANISVNCLPNNKNFWSDSGAMVALSVCILFTVIIAIATICDVFFPYIEKKPITENTELNISTQTMNTIHQKSTSDLISDVVASQPEAKKQCDIRSGIFWKLLLTFSAYTNGKKVFDLTPGKDTLSCINGLRFFSMTWVVLIHTYTAVENLGDNSSDASQDLASFPVQPILQGTLSVDTFFAISGLLVTYLFLKDCDRNGGKISWVKFYLHRYWRLTAVYIAVLFLLIPTFKYWGEGPLWQDLNNSVCPKYWWRNLLYINNLFPMAQICMGHTWYLANDMQFYIISPIILFPLARKLPVGIIISGILLIASWIATGVISSYNNLTVVTDLSQLGTDAKMLDSIYDKPYCRIGPYIIGMLCGLLLFKTNCKFPMKTHWVVIGWIIATACCVSVVFGLYNTHPINEVSALYWSLSRSAWALGVCWLIFACCNGYGGIVNSILSWPGLNPLSRLTYCTYLWHFYMVYAIFGGSGQLLHYSRSMMVLYYVGNVALAYAGSVVISLAFEAPSLGLEKVLLKK